MTGDVTGAAEHVVIVTNMLPPYRVPLFEALQEKCRRLTVLIDTERESDRQWQATTGKLSVSRIWGVSAPRRRQVDAGRDIHLGVLLLPQLLKLRPSTVISAELGLRTIMAVAHKMLRPRTRLVIWLGLSERTEKDRGARRQTLRRLLLRRADAVVLNGASAAGYVRRTGFYGDIHLAPQATDFPLAVAAVLGSTAEKASMEDGETVHLRALFVGTNAPRKNLRWLIETFEAWSSARQIDVGLIIAGVPADEAPSSAGHRSEFLGYLEQTRLVEQYDAADLMIFPTLADEWGLVVNESLGRGTPVIGSVHAQAVTELVRDGVNGFAFDPETAGGLEAALDAFVEKRRAGDGRALRTAALATVSEVTIERLAETFYAAVTGTAVGSPAVSESS